MDIIPTSGSAGSPTPRGRRRLTRLSEELEEVRLRAVRRVEIQAEVAQAALRAVVETGVYAEGAQIQLDERTELLKRSASVETQIAIDQLRGQATFGLQLVLDRTINKVAGL